MIQGLKVTLEGPKVYELISNRIDHHEERRKFYAEKAEQLKGVDIDAGVSGGNALQQMEGKRDQHDRDATELAFMAAHLDLGETYILDRSDLQRLGVVGQGW